MLSVDVVCAVQVAEEAMIEADGVVEGHDLQVVLTLEDFEHECMVSSLPAVESSYHEPFGLERSEHRAHGW